MKYLSEGDAENLLEDFGFSVIMRSTCKKLNEIPDILQELGLPVVMKVLGEKIVHKKKLGGVNTNVNNYAEALSEFKRMKKIKGAQGVMFQKKVSFNREFLIGVKATDDFGPVVVFGGGGSNVEEKKDVAFRVFPLERSDAFDLIDEVSVTKDMGKKDRERIADVLMKTSEFIEKYRDIKEMDINPLVLAGDGPLVLDARILFG